MDNSCMATKYKTTLVLRHAERHSPKNMGKMTESLQKRMIASLLCSQKGSVSGTNPKVCADMDHVGT
jgi:hypothetical protein